jgi:hypothetical protein
MKRLPFLLALPGILGLSLLLRTGSPAPSAAVPVPNSTPEGPATAITSAASPPATISSPRYLPEPEELLAARVSLRCGTRLLETARHADGPLAAALLNLAEQQFRDCLRHEAAAAKESLFDDARHQLEWTNRLLARRDATPPAPPTSAVPSPPKPPPPPAVKIPEPVMVGPDGVLYHRLGKAKP